MSLGAARELCRQLNLKDEPAFLAAGATCRVYRVGEAALRIGKGRFTVDAELRRALLASGVPVAAPLVLGGGWSLDTFLKGESTLRIGEAQAEQIGAAVSVLHSLPVLGWGLLSDQSGPFVGQAENLLSGVQTRLQDAWPFGSTPLEHHLLIRFAPDLLPRLRPLKAAILALADLAPVINHSDLHREQFLFEDGQLTGWLDFGDAVAGPPGWDAASFAYFWGWKRLPAFLEGYSSSALIQSQLAAQARLMAVPLAFHRASCLAFQSQRLMRATAFVRSALGD
ncbi:phosphotransferase [Deinococcus detaillensis]|uniref:Phosphotransferase n=1 Tax=Deinococcus detaillensis TaxID=2592048 RepID=A0A553V1M7_9DEIO|nr:phosphotransferase [Deinococcus detaillensis]TSA86131.1 phosphotransferase [Deinococcus detaillensis]